MKVHRFPIDDQLIEMQTFEVACLVKLTWQYTKHEVQTKHHVVRRVKVMTNWVVKKASNWNQTSLQLSISKHDFHAIGVPKLTGP